MLCAANCMPGGLLGLSAVCETQIQIEEGLSVRKPMQAGLGEPGHGPGRASADLRSCGVLAMGLAKWPETMRSNGKRDVILSTHAREGPGICAAIGTGPGTPPPARHQTPQLYVRQRAPAARMCRHHAVASQGGRAAVGAPELAGSPARGPARLVEDQRLQHRAHLARAHSPRHRKHRSQAQSVNTDTAW